jgi:histidyl-tRNA synthetase
MFRSERPQKGRTRQFHQIGVEVFGSKSPYADAEVIMQLSKMLGLFGLNNFVIKLNSIGCKTDKENFASELKKYLKDKQSRLCDNCRSRINTNVLRVLDCKVDTCIQVLGNAPNILDTLCGQCKDHYDEVKDILSKLGIKFEEAKNLVRGLDYYTGTVFEITHPALGAQDAIGAGGRYDNLVKDMGGPDIGAIGYALGMERILIALKKEIPLSERVNIVFIASLCDAAKIQSMQIAEKIRSWPHSCIVISDIKEASLKSQLRQADKSKAKFVIIIGEDEVIKGVITLKDMTKKEQLSGKPEVVLDELKRRLSC